jgi:thymidylate synthase (FAD) (EC 2.1.1.148)
VVQTLSTIKVTLVSFTKDGERVVAVASKMSRSRKGWDYHWQNMSEEEVETWIRDAIIHGYWSVLEHSVYTFSIEGISRVASHQLVRHRIASYTQMSHRFAKPVDEYYRPVYPLSAERRAKDVIEEAYRDAYEHYYTLLELGVPEEDARYVLPNGVNTNVVVTMNARELYNFSREAVLKGTVGDKVGGWRMLEEVKKVHPRLFKYAGPNCLIHENFVRKEPITLEDLLSGAKLVSERCSEGVEREGIARCVRNATSVWKAEEAEHHE